MSESTDTQRCQLSPFFLGLEPWAQVALMSAFRGPDVGLDRGPSDPWQVLKDTMTKRIRHIIYPTLRTYLVVTDPLTIQDVKAVRKALVDLHPWRAVAEHYINHLQSAIQASQDHLVWGGYARVLITMIDQWLDAGDVSLAIEDPDMDRSMEHHHEPQGV